MTAQVAISKLRSRLPPGLAAAMRAEVCGRVAGWACSLSGWLQSSTVTAVRGEGLAACPGALPGFNQKAVMDTWQLSHRRMVCTDGRLRLAGEQTLDVCVTPGESARGIRYFACWLDYLAADGIGVEIRKIDGWRTCAVVDGVAVPIRIRERLHRVQSGNRLTARLERMLGGRIPTVLVPSGRIELQLLRMGVSFASFPVTGALSAATLQAVSNSIREMAKRQVEYQERMHAVAVADVASRRDQPARRNGRKGRGVAETVSSTTPATISLSVEALASLAALSAMGAGRVAELLHSVEAFLAHSQGRSLPLPEERRADTVGMAESITSLAMAITSAAPEQAVGPVAVISDGDQGCAGRSRRARRSRRVA